MVMVVEPLLINAMATNSREMPRERDTESGKYQTAYCDEDFFDAIRKADEQPSTPEIADTLGCANRTALIRLHELAEAGKVKRRKVGAVNLWSLSADKIDE
jgi:hypothetical protein